MEKLPGDGQPDHAMRVTLPAEPRPRLASALDQPDPQVLHDFEPRVVFDLEPVDAVTVTTLMDNVTDVLMPGQGPAHRPPRLAGGRRPAATMEGGDAPEALVAEHGFSVLVTVSKDGSRHQILFDTGASPNGVVENMRRLQVDPSDIEAIVCSHGHYDHTTGLDGLIRRLGTVNLPVLIHPQFWRRRRLVIRGRDPQVVPTTSRRALASAGFEVIEDQQPSFLFDRSVLVTSEVPRTTGYEPGLPPQQAWLGGRWEPDPLVLDEQALIVDIKDKGLLVITGCGHAGIVNICRYARRLTKERPLYTVMGGFHLNGPIFEPLIPRVLDDLGALMPSVIVPALHRMASPACHGSPVRGSVRPQHRRHPLPTVTRNNHAVQSDQERAGRRRSPEPPSFCTAVSVCHDAVTIAPNRLTCSVASLPTRPVIAGGERTQPRAAAVCEGARVRDANGAAGLAPRLIRPCGLARPPDPSPGWSLRRCSCRLLSLVAVRDDGLTRAVRLAPLRTGANRRDRRGRAGHMSCKPGRGVARR